jgi:hypothetical protein
VLGEQVYDLPLPLIAPLGAYDDDVRHGGASYPNRLSVTAFLAVPGLPGGTG